MTPWLSGSEKPGTWPAMPHSTWPRALTASRVAEPDPCALAWLPRQSASAPPASSLVIQDPFNPVMHTSPRWMRIIPLTGATVRAACRKINALIFENRRVACRPQTMPSLPVSKAAR